MTEWEPAIDDPRPDLGGMAVMWMACACIWAVHFATFPLQLRKAPVARGEVGSDPQNSHHGAIE